MNFEKNLIAAVRKHEILYNIQKPAYRNKYKKAKIWKAIARELNANVDQCKRRWKGLRDTYKRYNRKDTVDPESTRKWKYYNSLTFLDGFLTDRRSIIGNIKNEEDIDDDDDDSDESDELSTTNFDPDMTKTTDIPREPRTNNTSRLKANNEVTQKFSEFLDMANATWQADAKDKDSTTLLFQSLDKKIKEAKLPNDVVNALEAKIFKIVYDEVEKYHDWCNNVNQVQL